MIARLRGRLDAMGDDHAVVDVGGVGYLVFCSVRTLTRLPKVGEPVDLHVETLVRPESIALYGFPDPVERGWFRVLQTVQGVGARVALALLGVLSPDQLARAVMSQDRAALARASGVGQRLAGRIVSELKDRLGEVAPSIPLAAAAGDLPPELENDAARDAVSALVNLGYGRLEAQAAVARAHTALGKDAAVDALIRASLRDLGGG